MDGHGERCGRGERKSRVLLCSGSNMRRQIETTSGNLESTEKNHPARLAAEVVMQSCCKTLLSAYALPEALAIMGSTYEDRIQSR